MKGLKVGTSLATLVTATALALPASAAANRATSITSVEFHGSVAAPEIVVNGSEFGTAPPKASKAGCHASGSDYGKFGTGKAFGFINDTGDWVAGYSKACIAFFITSWSETQIVFHFGNNYEAYNNLDPGYDYVVQVKEAFYGGLVSYGGRS